jgi:O-antigen/teichoic acid export membrane protein
VHTISATHLVAGEKMGPIGGVSVNMDEDKDRSSLPAGPAWLKFFPYILRNKIAHRPNLIQVLTNTGWIVSDKVLRMVVGLFVGVWTARHLGPADYGLLSYVMAIVALFSAISSMGLNSVVVRDLISAPDSANSTLGTAFALQTVGGVVALALAAGAVITLRPDDDVAKLMVVILGMSLVFGSVNVVRLWFESKVLSKYVVWAENGVFLVVVVMKVSLLLTDSPLMYFVWVIFVENMLASIALLLLYSSRCGRLRAWTLNVERAACMIKEGAPLLLSGIAVMIYMRTDQVMLEYFFGEEAVGIYTAAIRISEAWYFIPAAIVGSVFPSIIASRSSDRDMYLRRLQKLYDVMVVLGVCVALPMTILGNWLMVTLYGAAYSQSGAVLAIHAWAGVFAFLGVASGRWYVLEGLQYMALKRTLIGAFVNVLMNLVLIPAYGVVGAAIATVMANIVAAYFYDVLNINTRSQFSMKTRSLFVFVRLVHA